MSVVWKQLVVVNPKNTSRICSNCGHNSGENHSIFVNGLVVNAMLITIEILMRQLIS